MNFKKMKKRFFSLSRANGGFTLVELIVVIAILAILGGVAVPAYSGYVEKAKLAGDEQLLAAVNTAFAAACAENGDGVENINDAAIDGLPEINGVSNVESRVNGANTQNYNTAFLRYFDGNDDAKFEVFEHILFDTGLHMFVDLSVVDNVTLSYNGVPLTLSKEAIEALVDSTFLTADTLNGSSGLLDKVHSVTQMAAAMADGALSAVFDDPTFIQNAMRVLGVTTSDEYEAKEQALIAAIIDKNPGMTEQQAAAQLGANSAVLYAANSAVNFTDEQINELFSTTGIQTIKDNLKGANTTEGMAQAALIYGMYTAYANSEEYGNATLRGNTENALAVLDALENDPNFKTYVNSSQGKTDMDAYLGALDMINDSANSDPAAVEHLMINGFNNSELKDLIADATGE